MQRRLIRLIVVPLSRVVAFVSPARATRLLVWFYRRYGMRIEGSPNYISSTVWFDGTDYRLISLGEGCTISSYVRVLTHDWALHTVTKRLVSPPLGRSSR